MKYFITISFIVFGYITSFANGCGVKDSVGVETVQNLKCVKYVVEKGETLYGISRKYKANITTLKKLNPSLDKGLKVGQFIYIPLEKGKIATVEGSKEKYSDSQGNKLHLVKKGETYYSIARKYKIPVNDLMGWNQKKALQTGKKIFIAKPQQKAEIVYQPKKTKKAESNTKTSDNDQISFVTIVNAGNKREEGLKNSHKATYTKKGKYIHDTHKQQVLIVPFYPNLYFSDADHDIGKHSHLSKGQVREVFRRNLLASIEPKGFQSVYLLGGSVKDSIADLEKIYTSVQYKHQEILENIYAPNKAAFNFGDLFGRKKKKDEDGFTEKYYGVDIKDTSIFGHFEKKYNVDYIIFVNQLEIVTTGKKGENHQRTFTVHFSLYQQDGKKVAGNKFISVYKEETNNIYRIIRANIPQIGKKIANEMPAPAY